MHTQVSVGVESYDGSLSVETFEFVKKSVERRRGVVGTYWSKIYEAEAEIYSTAILETQEF